MERAKRKNIQKHRHGSTHADKEFLTTHHRNSKHYGHIEDRWKFISKRGKNNTDPASSNKDKLCWKEPDFNRIDTGQMDPAPFNTFKLNFNGASRQNPGMAGYGGVVRDHTGAIHLIYHGNIEVNTNNDAELIALLQGLTLVGRYKLLPLIVEGDSEIIIRLIRKL